MQHTSCAELAARLNIIWQDAKCSADLRWLSVLLDTDDTQNSVTCGQHDTSVATLQHGQVLQLQKLEYCSREAAVIDEADPAMVTCSGAAKSDEEAERVCEALKNAGIVLRVGDMVYLKPEEVVEIILRVSFTLCLLPTGALTEHLPP